MDDLSAERVTRQGLGHRLDADVRSTVALTTAIQAQDAGASRLGVRARSSTATEADVVRVIVEERSVVRTWLLRATIHLVDAADVRWMTALLGPMIRRRFSSVRWPALGMSPAVLAKAELLAAQVLEARPLTRHELTAALIQRGLPVDPLGQAPTHLAMYLSTIGLICRGPERHAQATFTLLDSWLPGSPTGPRGDDALAELARRYFRAFSPATAADFTAWSGLPSARAIELIRSELTPATVCGRAGYRLGDVAPATGLRLLPAFDNYLIGYRDRAPISDESRRPEVYVGGIVRPTILLDGRVIGRWQLIRAPSAVVVEVTPFCAFSSEVRAAVQEEVHDIARFLAVPAISKFGDEV